MYLLIACLTVIVVIAQISSRWAWNLFRDYQLASPSKRLAARRRAGLTVYWAGGLTLLGALLLRVSGPELGAAVVNVLAVLVSIFCGLFIGIIGALGAHRN
ncbi:MULTISPECIES: hypothetical protein [unclassified Bradyrhizobium]|uniref:hypothetical protein n=1 Tax=unclassified Bradyrhizobium TaxID=2631580 RepID=UPI0028E7FC8B|nr:MULTISPECIES: hypothetical protein [unclassified Bradyrhizobium]